MAFADPGIGRHIICGPGPAAATVLLAQACEEGDILGYSTGWKLALATVGSVINPQVVALKKGAIGDYIPVAVACVVQGYTGATPGALIYLAEGSASGDVTETAPTTTNDVKTVIGVALAADTVSFNLSNVIVLSA
jgi:hypothetical protein